MAELRGLKKLSSKNSGNAIDDYSGCAIIWFMDDAMVAASRHPEGAIMQHNPDPADLDLDFELFFTRDELVAAEWDLDFAEGEESESTRSFVGIEYTVSNGEVRAELIYQVEDAQGYVTEEKHDHYADDLVDELASLDATTAARLKRQSAALALLDERDCGYGRMGNTLAEMAGHIRSLRDLGEAGQLAAVMIADQIHDDEREAAMAMAGAR